MTEKIDITIKWYGEPQARSQSLKALRDDFLPSLRKRIRMMQEADIFLSKTNGEILEEDEHDYKIKEIIRDEGQDIIIFLQRAQVSPGSCLQEQIKKNQSYGELKMDDEKFDLTKIISTNDSRLSLIPDKVKNEERFDSLTQSASTTLNPSKISLNVLRNNNYLRGYKLGDNGTFDVSDSLFFEDPETESIPDDALSNAVKTDLTANYTASKNTCELYTRGVANAILSLDIPFTASLRGKITKDNAEETLSEQDTIYFYRLENRRMIKVFFNSFRSKIREEVKNFFQGPDSVTKQKLKKFHQKYGQVVPTVVTLGGRMFRYEEESGKNKAQGKVKNNKAGAQAKVRNGGPEADAGGGQAQKEEKKEFEQDWKKKKGVNVIGGDKGLSDDPKAWQKSLEDPNTWQIIEFDSLVATTDFLDEDIKAKIAEISTQSSELEKQGNVKAKKEVTSSGHEDIPLKRVMAICSANGVLVIFFRRAIQFLYGPEFKESINISVHWKSVYSVNCREPDEVYALTDEGLYIIDVKTRKYKKVCKIKDVSFPAAIIQHADQLYLFTKNVCLKVDREPEKTVVYKTLPGSYANAITYHNDYVYLLIQTRSFLSSQYGIYKIDLNSETKEPQLLTNDKTWSTSLLVFDSKLYIFADRVFTISLDGGGEDVFSPKNFISSVGAVLFDSQIFLAVGDRSDVKWRRWLYNKDAAQPVVKGLHKLYKIQKRKFKQIDTDWDSD